MSTDSTLSTDLPFNVQMILLLDFYSLLVRLTVGIRCWMIAPHINFARSRRYESIGLFTLGLHKVTLFGAVNNCCHVCGRPIDRVRIDKFTYGSLFLKRRFPTFTVLPDFEL